MKNFQNFTNSLKLSSLPSEMVRRIGAGVLVGGCLLLVFWSLTFRLSLVTEAQSHMHTPFSLGRQVASLEQLWSDEEAELVKQKWASVKARSFEDEDQLVKWVTTMTERAHALGLEVSYRIEEASTPIPNVPEIHRIGMELTIQAQDMEQGYQQCMQFVRALSEDEVKINFESLELTGTGQGAQKMELQLHAFLQQAI